MNEEENENKNFIQLKKFEIFSANVNDFSGEARRNI